MKKINDDSYYPQVLLKECKYTEKKVIRHIKDNLSDIFSSSDESDEKHIKLCLQSIKIQKTIQ